MKLLICFIFFSVLSSSVVAQEYAEFTTDTTRFRNHYRENEGKLRPRIAEQFWFINGQKIYYGSGTIKIQVNPHKLDTILYKGYRRSKFDTIICNISEPKKYTFYYNDCCGAFNIKAQTEKRFIKGLVLFKIKSPNQKTYMGTFGEAGVIINNKDTLSEDCRSAMSPNVYAISLSEIGPCDDSLNCDDEFCIQNKDILDWEHGFKTVSKKIDFLFMPLKAEPLNVIYDSKTDRILIE